jgi:hypothetical protein
MSMDDYYLFLNYTPIHLLETMYYEASCANNYYLSPVNVLRCDASEYLRTELSKIINAPFTCCGFLKTLPMASYPPHTDKFRFAAINMPLFEETHGFDSSVFVGKKIKAINYKTNYFTMLNVTKTHYVKNQNIDKERIMLSIGFKNNSYNDLKEMHHNKELINVTL